MAHAQLPIARRFGETMRPDWWWLQPALVLVLLTGGAQSLLADAGWRASPFWGGLHALDGLAILGIAGFLHGAAIRRGRAAAA